MRERPKSREVTSEMAKKFIKGILIHIGTNLWYEVGNNRGGGEKVWQRAGSDKMRFEKDLFWELVDHAKACGINTVVLDLADGIVYESHPELAIEGSIEREELMEMIKRLRELGLDIIPKLNFSTCHDVWLKDYSRMVSTKPYYDVCRDIINEVCDVFEPEIIHLGMDEENYENQSKYDCAVVRQNDLWWHDLRFLVDVVESRGAKAMIWSDYARHRPDEFTKKCPKSVVQCPWYYFNKFEGDLTEGDRIRVEPFLRLADAGYTIIAGGSNEYFKENVSLLDEFCRKRLPQDCYTGIIQTTWVATTEKWRAPLFEAVELMKNIGK
jgi:hypothetical protein